MDSAFSSKTVIPIKIVLRKYNTSVLSLQMFNERHVPGLGENMFHVFVIKP